MEDYKRPVAVQREACQRLLKGSGATFVCNFPRGIWGARADSRRLQGGRRGPGCTLGVLREPGSREDVIHDEYSPYPIDKLAQTLAQVIISKLCI